MSGLVSTRRLAARKSRLSIIVAVSGDLPARAGPVADKPAAAETDGIGRILGIYHALALGVGEQPLVTTRAGRSLPTAGPSTD
jgi:hypothetical protein